jgi:aminopeptidase N
MSYDTFPRYTANVLITPQHLNEYRRFFTPLQAKPALARVISLGLREIEARVALLERDTRAVQAALAQL